MIIKGNTVGHPLADPRNGLSMNGAINMNGQRITGLNVPVADDEAANKGYVDTNKVDKSRVVNNFTTEEEGFVADARALKLLDDIKLSMKLRWKNASPTSEFPEQTVSVNLSDGEYALIGFKGYYAINVTGYKLCKVGTVAELHRPIVQDQYYKFIIADRTATISADSVKFSNASVVNAVDAPSTTNSFLVPVEIYIVKGGST